MIVVDEHETLVACGNNAEGKQATTEELEFGRNYHLNKDKFKYYLMPASSTVTTVVTSDTKVG